MLGLDGEYLAGHPNKTNFDVFPQKNNFKIFHGKIYFAQFYESFTTLSKVV